MMNLAVLLVSVFLSNGVTCNGAPVATSSATTPRFNVSLCLTSTVPVCGLTYRFERIDAAGTMRVNTRTAVPGFDLTDVALVTPFTIGAGPKVNLGMTLLDNRVPIAPSTKRLLATYNVSVLGSKPATSYSFRLAPSSMAAIDPDGRCGTVANVVDARKSYPVHLPIDQPVAASFTLKKK